MLELGGVFGADITSERQVHLESEGVGFLAKLSDLEDGKVILGKVLAEGACGRVRRIWPTNCRDKRALFKYTKGKGLVAKTLPEVSIVRTR